MELKFNIEKKHAWLLTFLILAVGLVIAFGGNDPATMGHSIDEIDGLDARINALIGQVQPTTPPIDIRKGTKDLIVGPNPASRKSEDITFSPACPDANYQVFLTTQPMRGAGNTPYYTPFLDTIIDASSFRALIVDININGFVGPVQLYWMVVC